MRVVSGSARGRRLRVPSTGDVRPTPDRVREALFSILGERVQGARVLDLFSGTGALSLEALSRGASRAELVERDRRHAACVRDNVARCGFDDRADVRVADAARRIAQLAAGGARFDLVFADPPFSRGLLDPTLRALAESGILAPRATVVAEHPPAESPALPGAGAPEGRRAYGDVVLTWWRWGSRPTDAGQHDVVQYDVVQHDLAQHDLAQHDPVQHDRVPHDLVPHDVVQRDLVQHDGGDVPAGEPIPTSAKEPSTHGPRVALYPGSFDPLTNGHLDIIVRASALFDRLIIAVAVNDKKAPLFTPDERIALIEGAVADARGSGSESRRAALEVVHFRGLLVDYARARGATAVVRGLRAVSDFEYEFQMAHMNHKLAPELETVFMMTGESHFYVSSRLVKEVAQFGGEVGDLVPPVVHRALLSRLAERA